MVNVGLGLFEFFLNQSRFPFWDIHVGLFPARPNIFRIDRVRANNCWPFPQQVAS